MKIRIINAPSREIFEMMKRRMPSDARNLLNNYPVDAIALLMVSIPDLYFYADYASKSANVVVSEIFGSCPQHVTTLAILGEISAVKAAVQAIEEINNATRDF